MATINPLANPKGVKKLCELCQKPAYLQCLKCRVTYYCDVAHQQADWNSIHKKACQLLIPIRTPAPHYCMQADRDRHHMQIKKRLEHLMALSHSEAKSRVLEGKFEEALPAAQLSLHCAKEVHGLEAVQLVPAYLLLAEANVGLGTLSEAKQCVAQAEWMVLKMPSCNGKVLQQLHRTLGHLHTATGNYPPALMHFANDVYYASEEFGLDSVVTAVGYFLMATVFMKQEKLDVARSLYTQVASMWHSYLSKMMENYSQNRQHEEQCIDEVQRTEAHQMLSEILEAQQQGLKSHPAETALLSYFLDQSVLLSHSLAMLWFLCNNHRKALDFGRKAAEFCQQSDQYGLAESIQSLIQQAETHLNP